VKNLKYKSGERLKVKIHGDSSRRLAFKQTNFDTINGYGHTYKFYLNQYFA
jgi:hypothetical protein